MNYTFNIRTVVIALLFITVIIINLDSINYYKSKINKISRRTNEGKILMLKKKDIKNDVVLSNNRDYKMRANAINIIGEHRYSNVINFLNMYRRVKKINYYKVRYIFHFLLHKSVFYLDFKLD